MRIRNLLGSNKWRRESLANLRLGAPFPSSGLGPKPIICFASLLASLISVASQESPPIAPSPPGTDSPAASATVGSAPVYVPKALRGLVEMARRGASDDQLLAAVQHLDPALVLSADELIYLKDLGISSRVLKALLEHQGFDAQPSTPLTNETQGASPPINNEPANAPEPPAEPPPPDFALPPGTPPGTDESADLNSMVAPNAPVPPPDGTPGFDAADYAAFYAPLTPYGSWTQEPGAGWCWRPTAEDLNPVWQPYCDNGSWVWSDQGWYWNSGYSWGWGPFHYGRWLRHQNRGWVWHPDRQWGPAWVCWRESKNAVGWAPLPPGAKYEKQVGWTFHGVAVGPHFGFGLPDNQFAFVSPSALFERQLPQHRMRSGNLNYVLPQAFVNNVVSEDTGRPIFRGVEKAQVEAALHRPAPQAALPALLALEHFRQAQTLGSFWRPGTVPHFWASGNRGGQGRHGQRSLTAELGLPEPAAGATGAAWDAHLSPTGRPQTRGGRAAWDAPPAGSPENSRPTAFSAFPLKPAATPGKR